MMPIYLKIAKGIIFSKNNYYFVISSACNNQGVTLDSSTPLIQLSAALFIFCILYYSNIGKFSKKLFFQATPW